MIQRLINVNAPAAPVDIIPPLVGVPASVQADPNQLYGQFNPQSKGDWSFIEGDVTGVYGDATGLRGNLDLCQIDPIARQKGLDIATLVIGN